MHMLKVWHVARTYAALPAHGEHTPRCSETRSARIFTQYLTNELSAMNIKTTLSLST